MVGDEEDVSPAGVSPVGRELRGRRLLDVALKSRRRSFTSRSTTAEEFSTLSMSGNAPSAGLRILHRDSVALADVDEDDLRCLRRVAALSARTGQSDNREGDDDC